MEFRCVCDCGCKKVNNFSDEECEDCDNGTHWDSVHKEYIFYD